MIIKGAAAIFAIASANTPSKRPNSKAPLGVFNRKKIMWEEATQEQKEDKNLKWITDKFLMGNKTYCFIPFTKEEQQEKWLDKQYHLRQMINYILEHNGVDAYNEVIELYKDKFNKYEVDTNFKFPHCKYAAGQCDLFCKYYRGGCRFNDTLDQTAMSM